MDRSIIEKAFDEVIMSKSHLNKIPTNSNGFRLGFNEKVRDTLDKFHDETCGDKPLKKEKMILINDDGEVVYSKNGTKNSVSPNMDKVLKIRNDNGAMLHLEHNHPNVKSEDHPSKIIPTMLSEADVKLLFRTQGVDNGRFGVGNMFDYTYKSVTAESPNGSRITLMKNMDFNHDNEEDCLSTYHEMEDLWQSYCTEFASKKKEFISYYHSEPVNGGWFSEKYHLTGKSEDEVINIINDAVKDDMGGTFEDKLASIREDFNKSNVELSIEWK